MRIDTIRNQIAATKLLLEKVEANLDDLHLIAYDRPAAREAERVSGGKIDYALDGHGSTVARDLLRRGMRLTDGSCANLAGWAHDCLSFLADGEQEARRTPQSVNAAEFIASLEAQARRTVRREGTHANYPQPGGLLLAENRRLRKALAELERKHAKPQGEPKAKRRKGFLGPRQNARESA